MNGKTLEANFGYCHPELESIFYDEAKRIAVDENEAIRLTSEAVRHFLDHYRKYESKRGVGQS